MGMSQYFYIPLQTSILAASMKGFRRYSHTNLPICTKIMKHGRIHGLTAPYLMGMSQYFYIHLQTSILAASNGTSPMSIDHRVQEISLHKITHARQNHKTWLTSWAYSSKSDGDVTPSCENFQSTETDL